jgi:predicted DNA-binding transcriptional regulator YafY
MSPRPSKADEQLRRLLLVIPKLDDDVAHPITELAGEVGTDESTLFKDLRTLVERTHDEPAGFIEPLSFTMDATTIRLERPFHFRRPMALTRQESWALDLGLAIVRQESPIEEHARIDETRERLGLISTVPSDLTDPARAVHLAGASGERRATLQGCITEHCVAELLYQRANDTEPTWRRVTPLGFVHASGAWFLVAFNDGTTDLRVFRFDRIAEVRRTGETFTPAEFDLDAVVRDGRVFVGEVHESVRVRYSPRIARWITERKGAAAAVDGSVTVEYPLADAEWAVRHVLQYGPDAEVESPASVRALVHTRLTEMARDAH